MCYYKLHVYTLASTSNQSSFAGKFNFHIFYIVNRCRSANVVWFTLRIYSDLGHGYVKCL